MLYNDKQQAKQSRVVVALNRMQPIEKQEIQPRKPIYRPISPVKLRPNSSDSSSSFHERAAYCEMLSP